MKNFILIAIFSFLTFSAFGQFYDDCATAGSNIGNISAYPQNVVGTITTAGNTDDGTYAAGSLADPKKTAFYSFTVDADGYYRISFLASGVSPASGTLSVGWAPGSGSCALGETDAGDIAAGFDITSDCVDLTSGTTYYISMALEDASEGEFTITIDKAKDVCHESGSLEEMIEGTNLVDNLCTNPVNSGIDGHIWTIYTVTNANGDDHITVDISAADDGDGTPGSPQIFSVLLGDCNGDDVTANATCLSSGDILYIESGQSGSYGDYNVIIDQSQEDVANDNDDCTKATDEGILSCATNISGSFDPNACHDANEQDCAAADVNGVWYTFTVSPVVPTFSFSGTEFRVYTGAACGSLASLGCAGDVALDNINDSGETYWVMVYGSGSFTATSDESQPANDDCGGVVDLTMDAAAVTGTTTCADVNYSDPGAGCDADVFENAVWYSFTTGADQSKVRLTVNATTITPIAALILDACSGASPTILAPTLCDASSAATEFCVTPSTTYYLQISTSTANAGEFDIQVETVVDPANDNCSGAIALNSPNPIPSDCTQHDFGNNDNTNACPDQVTGDGCDFTGSNMHSVWYSFETDNNADFVTITTDLNNATFALLDACGGTVFGGSCTGAGSDLTNFPVNENATYYLLIGSDSENNNFNIGITIKNIPENNLCDDASDLLTATDGTNACADAELSGNCSLDGSSHEVYYTYTNNNGANVDLEVTIAGNTNTTGNAATNVSVLVLTDCMGILYNGTNEFCNTLGNQFTIECIEDGETIYLLVGSVDGDEGDFGLTVNEVVRMVTNDECSGAVDISYTACQWEAVSTNNTDACPEDFTAVGCDYDTEPVVWMKFTATADATSVEFDNLSTAGTGFLGLFEETNDCDMQTEAAAGSGCNTGGGPFGPFDINGGDTYFIAVGSSGGEGDISFDIKVNESPINDDPCANGFDPEDLTNGVAFMDDNTCAGFDFTSCNVDNTTGKTLFYEYTMTQDADLEITVAGTAGGAAGPFTIATYDGDVACNDESNFIMDNCTDNTLTLLCKLEGEKVVIMIGTSDAAGEFGEYEVTVNENVVARPDNDECVDAEEIIYDDADLCKWKGADANESNINACSEDNDFGTACDYSHEEVVWFKFTTPPLTAGGSSVSVRFPNYSGTGTLFATMFEDGVDCTDLTVATGGGCVTGDGPNGLGTVNPNTTYLIGVGSTGDTGGDFDIEIKITSGPANDDACANLDDFDLTAGGTLADEQTNACSGAGVTFNGSGCSGDDQTNAVFYKFTIIAPVYGINIQIKQSGADPIDGTVVAGISQVNTNFCDPDPHYTPPAYCEDISTAEFEWTCLEEGTYQLQISTSEDNSGTFEITSTMLNKPDNSCNANDICVDAKELTVDTECDWVAFKECNTEACPDNLTFSPCDLGQGPTVWYKVKIPTGASSIDVMVDNTTFGDVDMIIAKEAMGCPPTGGYCGEDGTLDNPIPLDAADADTYVYIAVTDPSGGDGGDYTIHIKIDVPPENDDPCETFDNPPIDLSGGGSHTGTTCCARGADQGDYHNKACGNGPIEDDIVWYTYTPSSSDGGIVIQVSPGTITGNVAIEAYWGDDFGCTGTATSLAGSACGPLDNPTEIKFPICADPPEKLYVKVGAKEENCGTFDISITEETGCSAYADKCEDIEDNSDLVAEPVTGSGAVCINTCNVYACTEVGDCEMDGHSVWVRLNTDDQATAVIIQIQGNGFLPEITMYDGNDCSDLASLIINCDEGEAFTAGVTVNSSYWIRIETKDGNLDDDFEICFSTVFNTYDCYDISSEVTRPDFPNLPQEGPYCPGETVHFHYDIDFEVNSATAPDGNSCQWIQGIIPSFGPAWNVIGSSVSTQGPPGDWFWLDEYNVDYNFNNSNYELFTHPITGKLVLSYTSGPESIMEGDLMPGGWWNVSPGGSAGCTNDGDPDNMYGLDPGGIDHCNTHQLVTLDFDISVKSLDSLGDCNDPAYNDLSLDMYVFADGETGCWTNLSCALSIPDLFNGIVQCEVPEKVIAEDASVCSGEQLNIELTLELGGSDDIDVVYDPNNSSDVSGGSDHYFSGGFGTIEDVLTITDPDACDSITVLYLVQSIDASIVCPSEQDTLRVTVYPPAHLPEQDPIPSICFDELPSVLNLDAECGKPPYTYHWEEDIDSKSGDSDEIVIDDTYTPGLHTFTVTITDELGCENIDELQFNLYPQVEFEIQGDTLCWGEEKEFFVDLLGRYADDFEFLWYWNPGDGDDIDDISYVIDTFEYGDIYSPGEFKLCLELSEEHDDAICTGKRCVDVLIRKPMNVTLDPESPIYICEGQGSITLEVVFDDFDGLAYDEVEEIYWNDTLTNDTEHKFSDTSTNNYVQIIDGYGCDTTLYFDILPNDVTDVEISGDDTICAGDCTILTVVEDFDSYTWNTGDTTKSITVCPTDDLTTYEVSAINSSGCVSSGSKDVYVFTTNVPNIPPTATFCTGYSTTITAPTGYQTYNWYYNSVGGIPVSNSQDVVIDKAGNYIIVVLSSEGCAAQDTVVATEASKLTPYVVGDTSLCFEDDKTLMVALGGNFTIYEWRFNDASGAKVIPETDKDSIYLDEGTYYLFVSDGNCDGSTTFTITRKPKIEPKILPDVDTIHICNGGDTTLTAPAGYDAYRWSNASIDRVITGVGEGKYYVTVTDDEGCQGVDSIYVNEYPRMYPSLRDSVQICADDTATLDPGKFADYIWSKDGSHLASFDGQQTIIATTGGEYSVVVSNAIGCNAFDTIKVIKTNNLTPVIVGAKDLCEDDEVILSVSGTFDNYQWTNSSDKVLGTTDTLRFTMTPGKDVETITLEVISNSGCAGLDSVVINRYHTPELSLNHSPIEVCGFGSTTPGVLNFNDYFIKGGTGNWMDFDNSNATHNADWSAVDFTNVAVDKTYRFVFRTTTAVAPCEDVVDTIFVKVKECSCEQWELSLFSDVCNDENSSKINLGEHVVTANGDRIIPVPAGVWTVTPAGTGVLAGNKFIPAGAESGTYTISYKFNNKGTYCTDSASQTITVQNAVNPGTPQPQHVCEGANEVFDLGGLLIGGDAGGTWIEVSSSPSTGSAFDANAGTFTTNGQNIGEYIFEYSLTGVDPCPDKSARVSIIVDPTPIADAGDVSVCFEDKPVTLHAKNEASRYEWTKKGSTDILGTDREYSTSESGTYVLKVLSSLGCSTEKDVIVDIKPQIIVEVSGASLLQNGASDTLFANVTGITDGNIRIYNWTKDGEAIDSVHSNYLVVSDQGVYCAEVEDNDGCTGEGCHTVSVAITKEIEVPNIFSPDGDGKNDRFFVKDGKNVTNIRTFKVWDRWGNLVYNDSDFSFEDRRNHFWDGNYNGKKAMQGVYVYLVEFTWTGGKKDFVTGDITLIR